MDELEGAFGLADAVAHAMKHRHHVHAANDDASLLRCEDCGQEFIVFYTVHRVA